MAVIYLLYDFENLGTYISKRILTIENAYINLFVEKAFGRGSYTTPSGGSFSIFQDIPI